MDNTFKRQTAYKIKIGDIFKGKPILDGDRLLFVELGNKKLSRVNIVANVIEKYSSDEKQFISFTIDDASAQIRLKAFGDDVLKFREIEQGDTVMVIGLIRMYNNEIYLIPEIIKSKDPRYLMVRKLEFEKEKPEEILDPKKILAISDQIIKKIKDSEPSGINTDKIVFELKESPELISQEIKKAMEQGIIYEPRPGIFRYLGID
jgi:RPA family protein